MTAISRFTVSLILTSAFLFGSSIARAEYDAAKLRQVAGGYLDAVEFARQLNESKCGQIVQIDADDFTQALADMVGYLSDEDVSALRAFLASEEFRGVQRQHRALIAEWIASSAKYQDEESACQTAGSSVRIVYETAKQQWLRAKASFGT